MWHPSFCASLMLELQDYYENLKFIEEINLNKAPRRIDTVVLVLRENIKIEKNIAQIFRKHNIFEYKSPDDSLTVNDFYNGLSYAFQYKAIAANKANIDELTLSFVCSKKPVSLFKHLETLFDVSRSHNGIYGVSGTIIPVQIIYIKELDAGENLYLSSLRRDIDEDTFFRLLETEKKLSGEIYTNFIEVVAAANADIFMEVVKMKTILKKFTKEENERLQKLANEVMALNGWDKAKDRKIAAERRAKEKALAENARLRERIKILEGNAQ
jgi:hypothetical protein